jgi:hypothetical protein
MSRAYRGPAENGAAVLPNAGVHVARNLYEEAGQALADDATAATFDPDE